jgi:flagellin-like hook-associated protein FlgL
MWTNAGRAAPLALCAAVCFTNGAAAKPAAKAPPARAEIQALYNKINAAAMQKNVDGVYAYDGDDYTVIDQKGRTHEPSEGRQDLEQALEVADSVKATTVIQSFTGTDAEATVTIKDHVAVSVANATTGRAVKITVDDTAREHWVKTEDGWRRTRTRILSGHNALHKNF